MILTPSIFKIHKIDILRLRKKDIARTFFHIGVLIAYWGALMPWFVWKIENVYFIFSFFFILMSMLISRTLQSPLFTRKDSRIPMISYLILVIMMRIVNGNNVNSYISLVFYSLIFLSLFTASIPELKKLMKFLCKVMGILLAVSLFFFILYVFGFPLPNTPIAHEELMYSYTNYYFFLIDDRAFLVFLPRFHSVFMEPGHLGTAGTFLLLTQLGNWKKWYNAIILVSTILTFSLAAFVLLVMVMFVNAWVKGKRILPKLLCLVGFLIIVTIGARLYNDGDNLLNTLIIERLEIDDGKLAGDNRVTDTFEAAYNDFLQTDDILFGREYELAEFGWGNAGYRVYIYDYGLVVLALTILFYILAVSSSKERRAIISMFVIAVASFWVRATPLSFYYFIPLYAFAYIGHQHIKQPTADTLSHDTE